MATDSPNQTPLGEDDAALTSPPAPLQPQAQAQTHSLDIPGKQTTLQQQAPPLQPQQQQDNDPNSEKNVSPQELTLYVEKLLEQMNAKFNGVSTRFSAKWMKCRRGSGFGKVHWRLSTERG
ncbi:unnamed protein product [Mortierella alpina]